MVCLFLLSLIGSFGAVKGWKMLRDKKFYTACHAIDNLLYETKVLSQTYQIDVKVIFAQNEKGLTVRREVDNPPKIIQTIVNKDKTFPHMIIEGNRQEITYYSSGYTDEKRPVTVIAKFDPGKRHQYHTNN